MHKAIAPFYERLKSIPFETRHQLEEYEKDLLENVKKLYDHIFATSGILTRELLPEGRANRRKFPIPQDEPRPAPTKSSRTPNIRGQTAPTLDAGVEGRGIKRWGGYTIEARPMGESFAPYQIAEEDNKKILILNIDFPEYQTAKRAGTPALNLYTSCMYSKALAMEIYSDHAPREIFEKIHELRAAYAREYGASLASSRFRKRN